MAENQIAEATLYAMNIQTIAIVVQTILGLAAILLAFREVRKWKTEALGSKKIDLAVRLGTAAIAFRDAFKAARLPTGGILVKNDSQPNLELTPEMMRKAKEARYHEYLERLEIISNKLTTLYEIRWEISVLFDEKQTIVKHVERYNNMFNILQTAMNDEYEGRATDSTFEVLYAPKNSRDKYTEYIESVTDDLLEIAKKYTH